MSSQSLIMIGYILTKAYGFLKSDKKKQKKMIVAVMDPQRVQNL